MTKEKPKRDRTLEYLKRNLAQWHFEMLALRPMVARIRAEGTIPDDLKSAEHYCKYVWKHHFSVPGRDNTYHGEPNLVHRYEWLRMKVAQGNPKLLEECIEKALGFKYDSKRNQKIFAEIEAEALEEAKRHAHEVPTAEEMCDREASHFANMNTGMGSYSGLPDIDAIRQTGSEADIKSAESSWTQADIQYDDRWQEIYNDRWSMTILDWKAKAEAGEIPPRGIPERFTREAVELTEEQVAEIRAERLDKLVNAFHKKVAASERLYGKYRGF
jgi:hypothetical protein